MSKVTEIKQINQYINQTHIKKKLLSTFNTNM